MDLNGKIFELFWGFAHRSGILDAGIIFFAKYLTYFLVIALIIWLFSKDSRKRLFIFAELSIAAIVARGLITEWIRFAYYHARPFEALGFQSLIPESGASFPSGHMTFLFALGLIVWLYNRKFGYWFLSLSFVVGIARIAAGVHWPMDILGGLLVGALSAIFIHKLLKPYWERLVKPKEKIVEIEEIDIIEIST
ncbi:MAG: hypothetical protein LiPW15_808 [Parcubacteria group bacterium LiPW_15]|nr:MAG: hypothetical protein LiPW15_808 [Parcubacteria group bacterium LiPW_15]